MAKAKPIRGLDSQAPTGKNARIIARARLEEMNGWGKYVDNAYRVRELHDLRIAAKRLRYTLEVFEDVLPGACKLVVDELAQIQDELGALHDVAPTAEERYGLEHMLLKQQQCREERYTTFRQHWYQLQARDFRHEILSILDAQ